MSNYFEPDNPNVAVASTVIANGATAAEITRPDDLAGITVLGNNAANTYGPWTTAIAAGVLAAYMLTKVSFQPNTNANMKYQIGTGGVGSEVALRDFAVQSLSAVGVILELYLPIPAQIPANARVAIRIKSNPPGAANGGFFWLGFMARPIS